MTEDYELMAERLIRESGKKVHSSTCATSIAPAEKPGPCDCNEDQPKVEHEGESEALDESEESDVR